MRELEVNPGYVPCPPIGGDEMLDGFHFNWNISRTAEWIEDNPGAVELSVVQVGPSEPGADSANLEEAFIPRADLSNPPIVVRMRPEFFRLIDGHHRVAKARSVGAIELPACYLTQEQHLQFFTSQICTKDMWIIGKTS